MNRFNPPEPRRLRALLRRHYGARGSFAEQVEAVASQLPPTPGSRLAFLGRVHHELSLEQVGDNITSPGDFRQACEVLTGDLQGANARPAPVARNLLSWPLLLVGFGLLLGGLDVSEANLSRLAVLGPLCVVLCLPVILSPGGDPNPVAWAVATVSPIALGYLTNLHLTPAFLWGALLLQAGLLMGPSVSGQGGLCWGCSRVSSWRFQRWFYFRLAKGISPAARASCWWFWSRSPLFRCFVCTMRVPVTLKYGKLG